MEEENIGRRDDRGRFRRLQFSVVAGRTTIVSQFWTSDRVQVHACDVTISATSCFWQVHDEKRPPPSPSHCHAVFGSTRSSEAPPTCGRTLELFSWSKSKHLKEHFVTNVNKFSNWLGKTKINAMFQHPLFFLFVFNRCCCFYLKCKFNWYWVLQHEINFSVDFLRAKYNEKLKDWTWNRSPTTPLA